MKGNLFIAANQKIKDEEIQINENFKWEKSGAVYDFSTKNKHFFYYYRSEGELYYAQLKSIKHLEFISEANKSISDYELLVKFKNGFFLIEFINPIKEVSLDILKDVYAKRNIKMIGDRRYSIYHTIQASDFSYSLPEIDSTIFMKTNEFRDMLLYENYIIPEKSERRKTFAKIVNEDNEFSLTLTNENMLEVDYRYLLEDQHKEIYRPYFYEFFPSERSQRNIKIEIERQNYSEEVLYEIKIVSKRDVKGKDDESMLDGELLFSASPVMRIPVYIKILHTNKDKILEKQWQDIEAVTKKNISTVTNAKRIEQAFMKKIPLTNSSSIKYHVKIYNVGQGNWIDISVYDGINLIATIVFDIGIGKKQPNSNLCASITKNAAKKIKNNTLFVLSHWDLDHIQGIVELERNQFNTTWIVPELPKKSSNGALRLAAFLSIDSNIFSVFIDHSLNGSVIFENKFFRFGKGEGKATSYTIENNSGLILAIKKSKKKMLFPGDCDYSQFPMKFINDKYEASIISHHGAAIKSSHLKYINCQIIKFAAVCVGKGKKYPNSSHISSVLAKGCQLHQTKKFKLVSNPCQYKLV